MSKKKTVRKETDYIIDVVELTAKLEQLELTVTKQDDELKQRLEDFKFLNERLDLIEKAIRTNNQRLRIIMQRQILLLINLGKAASDKKNHYTSLDAKLIEEYKHIEVLAKTFKSTDPLKETNKNDSRTEAD